jgi:hypothetical protein
MSITGNPVVEIFYLIRDGLWHFAENAIQKSTGMWKYPRKMAG